MRSLVNILCLVSLSGSLVVSQNTQDGRRSDLPEPGTPLVVLVESVYSIQQAFCRNCLIAIDDFSDVEPDVDVEDGELTGVMRQMLVRYFCSFIYIWSKNSSSVYGASPAVFSNACLNKS